MKLMKDLVNLQLHRRAKTCKKLGHNVCRFNFPLPPMKETLILQPLDEFMHEESQLKIIKDNYAKVKELLDDMKYGEDITFNQFLQKLQLSECDYITAIKYSLKCPTLLLKRSPSEIRVNNYNTNLLKAWQANMDVQRPKGY